MFRVVPVRTILKSNVRHVVPDVPPNYATYFSAPQEIADNIIADLGDLISEQEHRTYREKRGYDS
jgi:hypothetical protein